MASDLQQVLDSIPALLKKEDAQALVALREHDQKKVRKAVGKALHTLKSRGVTIPDGPAKTWSTGDVASQLRSEGASEELATVDTAAMPGALRFMVSLPHDVSGARLYVGTMSPEDRMLEFAAYQQTDGQRGRLERDWKRRIADRVVPMEWIKARIVWARGKTIAAGFSVPRALDEAMPSLGATPSDERPKCFLHGMLEDQPAFEDAQIDELLVSASVQQWPPLLDLDPVLQRAAEIHGDSPQPTEDDERTELMRKALDGQEEVRAGLSTVVANAFEDAAVGLWLDGKTAPARHALDVATQLRETEAAEGLAWVPRLLGFQVASLLRLVQAQGGMPGGASGGPSQSA